MTRLVVTADADIDARDIISYLRQKASPRVAADYARRFNVTIERLLELPQSGAPRPALGRDTRIAIVQPYLLIYDYVQETNTLTLLRIMHGRRNVTPTLLRR
jgi:plasmid stabilization system protein ParE